MDSFEQLFGPMPEAKKGDMAFIDYDGDGGGVLEHPTDLATEIRASFTTDARENLARLSAELALEDVRIAYRSPHVKQAAIEAARYALGLKTLPEEGEI